MGSQFDSSVTQWLDQLKHGDQQAARKLWDQYFQRLVKVARVKLGTTRRRVADEEDVALSVFDALCQGAVEGRFEQLADRDDLWRLLVAIASKKAVDQMRREAAKNAVEPRCGAIQCSKAGPPSQGVSMTSSARILPQVSWY
jgi:DNA-directed RNA polymerase specialized sigma24 family protein